MEDLVHRAETYRYKRLTSSGPFSAAKTNTRELVTHRLSRRALQSPQVVLPPAYYYNRVVVIPYLLFLVFFLSDQGNCS
jgi:hypothetical protein